MKVTVGLAVLVLAGCGGSGAPSSRRVIEVGCVDADPYVRTSVRHPARGGPAEVTVTTTINSYAELADPAFSPSTPPVVTAIGCTRHFADPYDDLPSLDNLDSLDSLDDLDPTDESTESGPPPRSATCETVPVAVEQGLVFVRCGFRSTSVSPHGTHTMEDRWETVRFVID